MRVRTRGYTLETTAELRQLLMRTNGSRIVVQYVVILAHAAPVFDAGPQHVAHESTCGDEHKTTTFRGRLVINTKGRVISKTRSRRNDHWRGHCCKHPLSAAGNDKFRNTRYSAMNKFDSGAAPSLVHTVFRTVSIVDLPHRVWTTNHRERPSGRLVQRHVRDVD